MSLQRDTAYCNWYCNRCQLVGLLCNLCLDRQRVVSIILIVIIIRCKPGMRIVEYRQRRNLPFCGLVATIVQFGIITYFVIAFLQLFH